MHRSFLAILILSSALIAGACGGTASQTGTLSQTSTPAPATATPAPQTGAVSATATAPATGDVVRLILVDGQNEARYRVREQLVRLSLPSDAVGATSDVTGVIAGRLDGTILAGESKLTVDLRTLRSDESRRDNFIQRNTLQSDRFPFAEFVPTEARGLPLPLPESGDIEFELVGYMTIRNVTQQVVWQVKARIEGDEASGQATTSFTFATFDLTKPSVPVILGVEDDIRLELDFRVRRE